MITIFIFFSLFFLEGAALLDRELLFFLYALLPAFYYLEKEIKKEIIYIPKSIFFSYLIFIFFSLISFLFSVDKINSINHLFFYFSALFILILGFNEKKKIVSFLKKILLILSFIFCVFSLLPLKSISLTTYQFIKPLYPNHNHLGDFLGLVLLWLLYDWLKTKEKKEIFLFLVFLPFFIFSFSRSAFIDFILIGAYIIFSLSKNKVDKKVKKITLGLIGIIILIFLFTQKEIYQLFFLKNLQPFVERFFLQPRSFFSGRPEYFRQAIIGFFEKPFFGWGLGNFEYVSYKFVGENLQQVLSALNLPLTILTETGILGFVGFLIFLILILKKINFNKAPFNYLFYYLCLNFLTDYTYSIYGFFLVWFLLAGMSINKKNNLNLTSYPLFAFLILFFIFLKLTSKILTLVDLPEIGSWLYSFDHQTQQKLIEKSFFKNNLSYTQALINRYYSLSSYSIETLNFLGEFYYQNNNKKKALFYYQKITDNNRFPSLEILKKVYQLKKEIEGKNKADNYFAKIFLNLKTTFWLNKNFEDEVYQFCFDENIPACRYRYFYIPKPKIKEENKNQPIKAVYMFNNEGFNERFDYQVKKAKDTYRILVLGDGNAFGFLVNTKDNWVEKLEERLNQDQFLSDKGIKKFEVINLSYHSYDLAYAIERFRQQGIKYQPDLIIFMNNNFYRINEIFLPLTKKYSYLENIPQEKEKLKKEGKYFPSWDLAWQDYLKQVKNEQIYKRQNQFLDEFFSLYKGKVLFVSLYEIPFEIKDYLKTKTNVKILEILDFSKNKDYYYKQIPTVISPYGYERLSEIIFEVVEREL